MSAVWGAMLNGDDSPLRLLDPRVVSTHCLAWPMVMEADTRQQCCSV
jgi:hypothetical protein